MDESTGHPLTRRELRQFREDTGKTDAPRAGVTEPGRPSTEEDFSLSAMFAPANGADVADAPAPMPTILTVCTGNICRSPLAATLLATRLSDLDLRVASAGTHALVGHGMPEPARRIALAQGADPGYVDEHAARLLTEGILLDADLVLAMTAEQSTFAVHLIPRGLRRTFALREFARLAEGLTDHEIEAAADAAGTDPRARLSAAVVAVADRRGVSPTPDRDEDVVDPYRKPFSVYEESAAQLVPALDQVERIVRIAVR